MEDIYRQLAKQRSVSLFADQEEKLRKLYNNKLALNIIRNGVDLALKQFEETYGFIYDKGEEENA